MNLKCREEIREIYELMEDDLSRDIFVNRLLYSLTEDKRYMRKVILSNPLTGGFISRLYCEKDPIAIFGAGMWGRFLVNAFDNIKFACFIDNHRMGQMETGLPVYSLDEFLKIYKTAKIVIAVKLHHNEIYTQLLEAGVTPENIINIASVWEKMTHSQYFDLPMLNRYDLTEGAFIDGGSYDGMSSIDYVKVCGRVEHVYAWEPDPVNQIKCIRTFEKYNIPYELIKKGMWDKEETVRFHQDNTDSAITDSGDIEIETARIDSYTDRNVAFIKMDLEGAEYKSLVGGGGYYLQG